MSLCTVLRQALKYHFALPDIHDAAQDQILKFGKIELGNGYTCWSKKKDKRGGKKKRKGSYISHTSNRSTIH